MRGLAGLLLKFLIIFIVSETVYAQVFLPMSFWRPKNSLTLQCVSGCYPTPTAPFTAATYYVPVNRIANFAVSALYYNLCWGPTTAGGCSATPTYPLTCSQASGSIDGSVQPEAADYTAPATVLTDTCNVTSYAEASTRSFTVQSFNPVIVSPTSSAASPINICVTKTRAFTASGGLGTLNWSIITGTGTLSSATGLNSTYTAPGAASTVQIQTIDPTTSMAVISYVNVVNIISLSPLASIIETPVNSPTFMQDPTTSAGTTFVANLNFSANCGVQNYGVSCVGGGSVSPTSVADAATVRFTPAATTSTSTVTFTDSAATPQTATRTMYNILPVDFASGWGYHTCVKYSHSTYAAGTFKIKCWGFNSVGQLGSGATTTIGNAATDLGYGLPFVKSGGVDLLVKEISVGLQHTCAVLSNDTVKCWGNNTYGQLGYDNTTALNAPPAATVNIGVGTPKKIYAGGTVTCLTFSDNRVKCWGRNAQGQLGQNNTLNYGSAATAASMANLGYISIGGAPLTAQKLAVSENAVCALTTSAFTPGPSSIYCWGMGSGAACALGVMPDSNYCGELGRGTNNANWGDGTNLMANLTPVNVGTSGTELVIDLAAGRKHICAIIAATVISTAGTPICWGYNIQGQLGNDNTTDIGATVTPTTRIASITTATQLNLAAESSCATLSSGAARCWGRGTYGVLLGGNNTGTTGGSYVASLGTGAPLMSAGLSLALGTGLTVKKLGITYMSACAILNNDFIKCWGAQNCGTGGLQTNNGCLLSGISINLNKNNGTPTMMNSRYVGDNAIEVGDSLPYTNH